MVFSVPKTNLPQSNRRLVLAWCLLAAVSILICFSHFISHYGWSLYLEMLSHFQVQYLGIALVLTGVLLLLRTRWPLLISLFLCGTLLFQMVGWYSPSAFLPRATDTDQALRIVNVNVNTQNRQYEQVLSWVRSQTPDIAVMIEVDQAWMTQLDTLKDQLPYSFGQSDPYNFGLVIYSNQPLTDARLELFGTENNNSIVTQLTVAGETVNLVATHPFPGIRTDLFHSRNRQLDLIAKFVNEVSDSSEGGQQRTIVVGDLNTTMWSPYYRRFMRKTSMHNTREGFGLLPSWPTRHPKIPDLLVPLVRIPIDHCLVSDGFEVIHTDTGGGHGSDHKPLVTELRVSS